MTASSESAGCHGRLDTAQEGQTHRRRIPDRPAGSMTASPRTAEEPTPAPGQSAHDTHARATVCRLSCL